MIKIREFIKITIVFLVLCLPAASFAQELIIVTNRSVSVDRLSREEIKAIYLGKKTKWADNSLIRFYLIRSPKSQKPFLEEYVGKTPEQFENYWMQNVFTGKGAMPDMFENSKEMIEAVGKTKGSIGFALEEIKDDNIKIITVE